MTEVTAGAATASGGELGPGTFAGFATELMDGDPAYGVRFTSDYEVGTDYPPVPPPPLEMGLHPKGHQGAD